MKRNCNLDLRLVTPPPDFSSMFEMAKDNQKLTIFYNGMVTACDMTEFQARAIILLASRQNRNATTTPSPRINSPIHHPAPPAIAGLSMKKSLQRFLQKRKTRATGVVPYSTENPNDN